jgi:hypothetical protein
MDDSQTPLKYCWRQTTTHIRLIVPLVLPRRTLPRCNVVGGRLSVIAWEGEDQAQFVVLTAGGVAEVQFKGSFERRPWVSLTKCAVPLHPSPGIPKHSVQSYGIPYKPIRQRSGSTRKVTCLCSLQERSPKTSDVAWPREA